MCGHLLRMFNDLWSRKEKDYIYICIHIDNF